MIKKYYKNWKATIINSNYSLKDTIKNLNKTALRLCLVNNTLGFLRIDSQKWHIKSTLK